jgi:hypothetical protein
MAAAQSQTPAQAYAAAMRRPQGTGRSKFGNRKTKVDGQTFDSAKEAARFFALSMLERAGEIHSLICQPKFEFVVNGVRIGSFRPDFSYVRDGKRIIEDVKGGAATKTEAYGLRKKLLLALHGLEVVET